MTKPEPLTRQVGGDHYSKLAIQPLEFATANRYDPCAFSILKYVTRWRDKGGVKDLEKALHIAEIRATEVIQDHLPSNRRTELPVILITEYNEVNRIPLAEARILQHLHCWIFTTRGLFDHGPLVIEGIKALIKSATNETKEPA